MAISLFNPFQKFDFNKNTCFLSGEKISASTEEITVFPQWLIDQFELNQKHFKLLDESRSTYQDLKLPCADWVKNDALDPLDEEIQNAFNSGYEHVKELSSIKLFQWISKIVYGIIYNEIRMGLRQQQSGGEPFLLAQGLIHKFGNLNSMMQSLIKPIEFEENTPWNIRVFKVENSAETFNYRDEINTLTFSLAMNDFGIIACLQDNGTNAIYHSDILEKIDGEILKPIQFEELIARFYYSNYLFNRLPEYSIMPTTDKVYIEAMPLRGMSNRPLFDNWQVKPYAQVLENLWKPWGITLFEIIKDPENPISFLLNEEGNFSREVFIPTPS
ncbi:hypothetical protein [Daejeonella oryzae]|uniref:hypothetical protein n=1 Tax=Daejeonella oryzae TaxID=1122943 RepID=UPI0004189B6E|nr:hypothetical protein [Daejeonella oryzae]